MNLRERLTASVTDIRTRGQRLVQLNLELLAGEIKEKGRRFGAAIALFAAAGVLALYAVAFALATVAVALALILPLWAALLIVTAVLFLSVAILALAGRAKLRQAQQKPVQTAMGEARATAAAMTANVRETTSAVRSGLRYRRAGGGAGGGTAPPGPASSPQSPALDAGPSAAALDERASES